MHTISKELFLKHIKPLGDKAKIELILPCADVPTMTASLNMPYYEGKALMSELGAKQNSGATLSYYVSTGIVVFSINMDDVAVLSNCNVKVEVINAYELGCADFTE